MMKKFAYIPDIRFALNHFFFLVAFCFLSLDNKGTAQSVFFSPLYFIFSSGDGTGLV